MRLPLFVRSSVPLAICEPLVMLSVEGWQLGFMSPDVKASGCVFAAGSRRSSDACLSVTRIAHAMSVCPLSMGPQFCGCGLGVWGLGLPRRHARIVEVCVCVRACVGQVDSVYPLVSKTEGVPHLCCRLALFGVA
jgi:hypothetical protein